MPFLLLVAMFACMNYVPNTQQNQPHYCQIISQVVDQRHLLNKGILILVLGQKSSDRNCTAVAMKMGQVDKNLAFVSRGNEF